MMDRLPTERKHAHVDALEKAWADVSSLNLETISAELGPGAVRGDNAVCIRMLGEPCLVDIGSRTVLNEARDREAVPPYLQILILHYLLGLSASPLRNRFVSFRELDGGALYYQAFKARAIDPLVRTFGYKPELLSRIAASLGAEPLDIGQVSFKVDFFEKVPVAVVLWLGDLEVSASASIMFDASANSILSTEDLTVVAGVTSRTLIKRTQ
ncbi:TPA: DUF3786 domain-containing protein [Thermoplasmata archaeon]|nr:DUF3786 domain-containing protein [Thermoplasmata archaeon]